MKPSLLFPVPVALLLSACSLFMESGDYAFFPQAPELELLYRVTVPGDDPNIGYLGGKDPDDSLNVQNTVLAVDAAGAAKPGVFLLGGGGMDEGSLYLTEGDYVIFRSQPSTFIGKEPIFRSVNPRSFITLDSAATMWQELLMSADANHGGTIDLHPSMYSFMRGNLDTGVVGLAPPASSLTGIARLAIGNPGSYQYRAMYANASACGLFDFADPPGAATRVAGGGNLAILEAIRGRFAQITDSGSTTAFWNTATTSYKSFGFGEANGSVPAFSYFVAERHDPMKDLSERILVCLDDVSGADTVAGGIGPIEGAGHGLIVENVKSDAPAFEYGFRNGLGETVHSVQVLGDWVRYIGSAIVGGKRLFVFLSLRIRSSEDGIESLTASVYGIDSATAGGI